MFGFIADVIEVATEVVATPIKVVTDVAAEIDPTGITEVAGRVAEAGVRTVGVVAEAVPRALDK